MTEQIRDQYFYKGEPYLLLENTGPDLFSPKDFGMEPFMFHTGCSCGFHAKYEITDGAIYLKELTIYDRNGRYAPIGGAVPLRAHMRPEVLPQEREFKKVVLDEKVFYIADESDGCKKWGAQYSNMNYQLPFSGIIRLGKDVDAESTIEVDLLTIIVNPAASYTTILDITIEQGKVVRINDRSAEMETKRRAYREALEGRRKGSRKKHPVDLLRMELQ